MSNLTDFLDSMAFVLNNPGKTMDGTYKGFMIEDGIDEVDGKGLNKMERRLTDDMTPEEKKIAQREYLRNYMREYKKTYVQPQINKSHETKRRRKYGTALITSMRRRKEAEKKGLIVTKNCYIIDPSKVDYKPKE